MPLFTSELYYGTDEVASVEVFPYFRALSQIMHRALYYYTM